MHPPRPLVLGHRGNAIAAPENTIAAFTQALDLGADGLETDLRLSRDGEVVLHHDEDLDRTTDGRGPLVAMDRHELAGLDAGSWFSPEFSGQGVPGLDDLLARLGTAHHLVLDPKAEGCAAAAARALRTAPMSPDHLLACAWTDTQAEDFRRHLPQARLALLSSTPPPAGELSGLHARGYRALSLDHRGLDEAYAARAQAAGLEVYLWTLNEPADLRRWLTCPSIRAVMTDDPARALAIRDEPRPS